MSASRGAASSLRTVLSLLLFLLVSLASLCCPSPSLFVGAESPCPCVSPPLLRSGDTVHVALLLWLDGPPQGLFMGDIADTGASAVPGFGSVEQPFKLGVDMYIKLLRAHGPISLANGANVTINPVVINMANPDVPYLRMDYGNVLPEAGGLPLFVAASAAGLPGSVDVPGGLFEQVTSTNVTDLQRWFGIDKPFTFIIPSALLMGQLGSHKLVNLVEDAQSHIVIHPFLPDVEDFICDGLAWESSATPDCLSPKYNRSRREGARRFETQFSTLFDSSGNQLSALDLYHTLGARRLAILTSSMATTTFGIHTSRVSREQADQVRIELWQQIDLVVADGCPTLATCPGRNCTAAANCPPLQDPKNDYQSLVWPDGQTAHDIVRKLRDNDVDAVMILMASGAGAYSIGQLFGAMRDMDWVPDSISFGGLDSTLIGFFPEGTSNEYTWGTRPWDSRLRGPAYNNFKTATSFELLPASESIPGPSVFQREFDRRYGPGSQPGGGAHPLWLPELLSAGHAFGWGAMHQMQKLLEAAMTTHVPTILAAAKGLSRPGVYHQIQMDMRVNEMVTQYLPGGGFALLTPYNIGTKPIYPMPRWRERVFAPQFYSAPNEQIMLALNSVCLLFCLALIVLVVVYWRSPVIRAATPSFSVIVIVGGVLMLCSSFFNTLVVNDVHCAAQVWLLTIGFTLLFAALFVKTFRVWRILGQKHLVVSKLTDRELLLALFGFVLVDVVINAAWQGRGGMLATRVYVDPHRPAYDYWTCDFASSRPAVYTHLATKGLLLLAGSALAWAVRGAPAAFNESIGIAAAIYNASAIVVFVVPILAAQLGGRNTVLLLRAYSIMFVALSTLTLIYGPKAIQLLKLRESGKAPTDRRPAVLPMGTATSTMPTLAHLPPGTESVSPRGEAHGFPKALDAPYPAASLAVELASNVNNFDNILSFAQPPRSAARLSVMPGVLNQSELPPNSLLRPRAEMHADTAVVAGSPAGQPAHFRVVLTDASASPASHAGV